MNNIFTERKTCIFCDTKLCNTYFESDYNCHVAHYADEINDVDDKKTAHEIPFNICVCTKCNTVQTKYLGDLNEIYKTNHADSTGVIMSNLHKTTSELIFNYSPHIQNIIEIGSSYGVLADNIIHKFNENNIELEYNVIEPDFRGEPQNKIIYNDFYENINDKEINANMLIISHVFEHFYNPKQILEKIAENENIKYFLLVFPDLEYYLKNNVLHVLNTEHTYYVDNEFIINTVKSHGFSLIERIDYKNHSVILLFERIIFIENDEKTIKKSQDLQICNDISSLDNYFNYINKKVELVNKIIAQNTQKKVYLWPASIHSFYLCIFGLSMSFTGLLDNSKNKIGKKAYGIQKYIYDFKKTIESNDKNTIVIINGGLFNDEIKSLLEKSPNITSYYM